MDFDLILYTDFWPNFHTNTTGYRFLPNFHPYTTCIHSDFWANIHPYAIDYVLGCNFDLNSIDYRFFLSNFHLHNIHSNFWANFHPNTIDCILT